MVCGISFGYEDRSHPVNSFARCARPSAKQLSGKTQPGRSVTPAIQTFSTLSAAIEFERTLWDTGEGTLRAWCSGPGICVPATYQHAPGLAAACATMEQRGYPVVIRRSGGGCVPQGPGIVNLVWIPDSKIPCYGVDDLYRCFARALIDGLAATDIAAAHHSPARAWCPGRYDISSRGRKLVGIAQRRSSASNTRQLVHAAIFVDGDVDSWFAEMTRFLCMTGRPEQPAAGAATTITIEAGQSSAEASRLADTLVSTAARSLVSAATAAPPVAPLAANLVE